MYVHSTPPVTLEKLVFLFSVVLKIFLSFAYDHGLLEYFFLTFAYIVLT